MPALGNWFGDWHPRGCHHIGGCLLGITAALAVSFGQFYIALTLLIANRIADGLDGAIARATRHTDRGAFFDIALDFLVYATVPLAFAIWSPYTNALPAALLLSSFVANGSAFLAFSVMAERRGMMTTRQGQKTIYYLAGIAEGFETIVYMVAFCLFPSAFPTLAIVFATLCWISAVARLVLGWKLLAADAYGAVRCCGCVSPGLALGSRKKDVRVDGEYRRVSGPA